MCRLGVFCDLWKNTSLHATLEKKSTLLLCSTVYDMGLAQARPNLSAGFLPVEIEGHALNNAKIR